MPSQRVVSAVHRNLSLKPIAAAGLALLLASAPGRAAVQSQDNLEKVARPFFKENCTKCHGEKKQKGDLRVDNLMIDFDSPKIMGHWEEIMNRINSGDMPPDDVDKRPKAEDIARVSEWIAGQLREADNFRQSSSGEKVAFRKLTREEYANTIRDLLGVTFDVTDPTGLPEDPDWHGIQRIGSVLTLSATHVEKYLAAADAVLTEALGMGPEPKREVTHWSAFDLRGGGWKNLEKEYEKRGIADKVRMDIVPNNGALDDRGIRIKTGGDYIVRVKLSGLRPPGGRAPRLRFYAADISRTLFEQDVDTPEDKPVTLEFRTHLPAGDHPIHIVNSVPGPNPEARRSRPGPNTVAFTSLQSRIPWQMKFTDDDGKPIVPFLLVDWIEWDGPIVDSWPTTAYQKVFFGGEHATKDSAYARAIITRFAERAWRRPVTSEEMDRYVKLAEKAQQLGDDFDHSIKTALSGILCSKSFLYIVEGDRKPKVAAATPARDGDKPAGASIVKVSAGADGAPAPQAATPAAPTPAEAAPLNDWELASRLSYFLWSTMPDDRLFDLARAGKLHERDTLRAEVRRMLADPKAEDFASSFPRQWLQLRRVGMFPPDKVLYPDYDEYLETSMVNETVDFFDQVLKRNASLREFLNSDWTMLNERLAKFYGIDGVEGGKFRRVALKPEDHRGGLLTQAAILSLTSDGTRHRPVHRGVWVLESIIGKPPPPPPANVPALTTPDANAKKTTLREKLELHRSDPTCNACHRRIDPLGLAFDNYDAIGRWRTVETVTAGTGDNPKVDPSGELYDGRSFADANGLKKILLDDTDKFATAFTEKLATYALRRGTTFSDRVDLKKVTDTAKPEGYKLASLIEDFVTSDLFQKR
jgi:mono/diheme cytochrome c family protein